MGILCCAVPSASRTPAIWQAATSRFEAGSGHLGTAVWAWGVLSVVLFALLQTLSGVDAAERVIRAGGGGLPEAFKDLEAVYAKEDEDEGRQ